MLIVRVSTPFATVEDSVLVMVAPVQETPPVLAQIPFDAVIVIKPGFVMFDVGVITNVTPVGRPGYATPPIGTADDQPGALTISYPVWPATASVSCVVTALYVIVVAVAEFCV